MKIHWIVLIGMFFSACSAIPPLYEEPDFSTPEKTLLTYYNAFQNKNLEREYECFSDTLKNRFNFGLPMYEEFRSQFEDQNSWLFLRILNRLDLKEHILDQGADKDTAWIKLLMNDEEILIYFVRKAGYRLEDLEGHAYWEKLSAPIPEVLRIQEDRLYIEIPMLSNRQKTKVQKKLDNLGAFIIESQWRILDLPFLKEFLNTN